MQSLGSAIKRGILLPENLIFWNNGLDSTSTESSEAVLTLIEIIQSASVMSDNERENIVNLNRFVDRNN